MTTHDPMSLLGERLPEIDPWESLARQARWLADQAEHFAALAPEALAPTDDRDPLAELQARALAMRNIVAACRRATFRTLREQGTPVEEIARTWGVSRQAVYKVLDREPTPAPPPAA